MFFLSGSQQPGFTEAEAAVPGPDHMVRQRDFDGAQPFGQAAGQLDIRPVGQGAVGPLLLDRQPATVIVEQHGDHLAPVAVKPQPVEWAPVIVEDEQVQGGWISHCGRMRLRGGCDRGMLVPFGAIGGLFAPFRIICGWRAACRLKAGQHGQNQSEGIIMRHPEYQYLDLLSHVLERGDERIDRTGVGTRSIFGAMTRFDLSDGTVPILTTKRVFWKTAVKEMLWFLTGQTNIQPLVRENVGIWTDWPLAHYRRETGEAVSQADFEKRIVEDDAFAAQWGELGPVYGKQWRRWMGPDGREHDQIETLISTLRTNPSSRRMLFHAWNVADLGEMALPPCHMVYQYHVTSDGRLNSILYQRSADLFLGASFNWTSAAALQMMLAQQAGLELGDLVWFGGDVHLYLNHLDQAREQLSREPRPWPKMRLLRHAASIDDYRIEDFAVEDYAPHAVIKADVAV